jgi:hypothetical protein
MFVLLVLVLINAARVPHRQVNAIQNFDATKLARRYD